MDKLYKTGLSPGKSKVLGMVSGELGSYTLGRALKLSNKDLAIESAASLTKVGVSKVSDKILSKHTKLVGSKRLAVGIGAGTIVGEGTRKILKRVIK